MSGWERGQTWMDGLFPWERLPKIVEFLMSEPFKQKFRDLFEPLLRAWLHEPGCFGTAIPSPVLAPLSVTQRSSLSESGALRDRERGQNWTKTRPRSNFPESRVAFPRYDQLLKLNTDETMLMVVTDYFGDTAVKQVINTMLLTFNISEVSSNNSDKLSLLANKHLWTFLLHSSYASSRM